MRGEKNYARGPSALVLLLAFMKGLVYDEPKLAAELFRHPDLADVASEPVFRPLVAEARAQAND